VQVDKIANLNYNRLGKWVVRINVLRVEQALAESPRTIVTACPYCAVMMADGLGTLGKDGEVASRDIAELVADALRPRSSQAVTATPSRDAAVAVAAGAEQRSTR